MREDTRQMDANFYYIGFNPQGCSEAPLSKTSLGKEPPPGRLYLFIFRILLIKTKNIKMTKIVSTIFVL